MQTTENRTEQMQAATEALCGILGNTLLALYLHGSGVSGGYKPQSDIDLLAVVDRDLTEAQRMGLLTAFLHVSGRHPAVSGGPRPIEVIVFRRSDLDEVNGTARAEFVYGEWLRDAFEAGERSEVTNDPEYTLVLAQARQEAMPLVGPSAFELLPGIPPDHIRQAMRHVLPALLEGFRGDERNVLLTLARMWRTATTGKFFGKDAAAVWAIPQLQDQDAATLDHARRGYLGEIVDEWSTRAGDAQRLAEQLSERVIRLS